MSTPDDLKSTETQVFEVVDYVEEMDPDTGETAVVINEHTNMLMNIMVKQQFQSITFRRICWPLPDRLCLLGRCGHCNDAPFRALGKIKHFIRHAPADWRPRLWDSYNSGKDNNFEDAQVWRGDWPMGVSRK